MLPYSTLPSYTVVVVRFDADVVDRSDDVVAVDVDLFDLYAAVDVVVVVVVAV